ncbi:hypothetical protein ACL02U_05665 [Streptomyces sp. MS06]|uniref:hypothetical protein n=1 Tax=Streptomyces sp. MS06 TaxID=3385974 RepID=UPI0039A32418
MSAAEPHRGSKGHRADRRAATGRREAAGDHQRDNTATGIRRPGTRTAGPAANQAAPEAC